MLLIFGITRWDVSNLATPPPWMIEMNGSVYIVMERTDLWADFGRSLDSSPLVYDFATGLSTTPVYSSDDNSNVHYRRISLQWDVSVNLAIGLKSLVGILFILSICINAKL